MVSLDQLKESYQMLNEELSKQQVVNEQLMNSIIEKCNKKIKKESNWMMRWGVIDMCMAGVFSLIGLGYIISMAFSDREVSFWGQAVPWLVFLYCGFAFFANMWSLKKLKGLREMDLPVQELTNRVLSFKRGIYKLYAFVFAVCMVVLPAYFYYLSTEGMWKDMPLNVQVIGGVIASVCGLTCGYLMMRWIVLKPLKKIEASCKELSDAENISETPDKES